MKHLASLASSGRERPVYSPAPQALAWLSEHFLDHLAMDIRQPPVRAIVAEGELFMVDAEKVQNRGVEIVGGGRLLGRLP